MPFLSVSGSLSEAARNSAILALITGVYYWRARTEERHLGRDPAYREYSEWMERNGPVPRLVARVRGSRRRVEMPAE